MLMFTSTHVPNVETIPENGTRTFDSNLKIIEKYFKRQKTANCPKSR